MDVTTVVDKLTNNEFIAEELVGILGVNNPITFYNAVVCVVRNNMKDDMIIDKLLELRTRLSNEYKLLGYYKIGHLAMATLLKLGIEESKVLFDELNDFEKEFVWKMYDGDFWNQ